MARPWSRVAKLVAAGDAEGLVELLCKEPPLKAERLAQVVVGLGRLDGRRVLPVLLPTLAAGRVATEIVADAEELVERFCREAGAELLLVAAGEDPRLRELALRLVPSLGPKATLDSLMKLLAAEDAKLRHWVQTALWALGPDTVLEVLLEGLEGPPSLRLGAVEALGHLRDQRALIPLMELLEKVRGPLLEAVQTALVRFGHLIIDPLLDLLSTATKREREIILAIIHRLGELPVETRARLHLLLGEEAELLALGQRAYSTLEEALTWLDSRHRYLAAKLLGELAAEQAARPLARLLNDDDPAVRFAALEALEKLGLTESIPALNNALSDGHEEVGRAAAKALGSLGAEGLHHLLKGLEAENEKVRQRVGRAILDLGEAALEPLWDIFQHGDKSASRRAGRLLSRLPELDTDRRVALLLHLNEGAALAELGPAAIPRLIEALIDSKPRIRKLAGQTLEAMGEAAVNPLMATLEDNDLRKRQMALQVLAGLGRETLAGLVEKLQDSDARLRRDSARALGALRAEKALEPLARALRDPETRVVQEAAIALAQLGEKGVEKLGASTSLQAVAPLINLMVSEAPLAEKAAQALVKIGAEAAKPLESLLSDSDAKIRSLAARSLGTLGRKGSIPALARLLTDKEERVREAAREALVAQGPKAQPALKKALNSSHWRVRLEAAKALAELGDPALLDTFVGRLRDSDSQVRKVLSEAIQSFGGQALEPLLAGLKSSQAKVANQAKILLSELAGRDLEGVMVSYLSNPRPQLKALLWETAPAGWVGERLESLGRMEEALEWYISTGCEDQARRLKALLEPEGEAEATAGEEPKPAKPAHDPALVKQLLASTEPARDISTQLQRLVLAHQAGTLTDAEFEKAKAKLLAE